ALRDHDPNLAIRVGRWFAVVGLAVDFDGLHQVPFVGWVRTRITQTPRTCRRRAARRTKAHSSVSTASAPTIRPRSGSMVKSSRMHFSPGIVVTTSTTSSRIHSSVTTNNRSFAPGGSGSDKNPANSSRSSAQKPGTSIVSRSVFFGVSTPIGLHLPRSGQLQLVDRDEPVEPVGDEVRDEKVHGHEPFLRRGSEPFAHLGV